MSKPMVIYVSGPYSAPTWEGRHDNLIKAVCVGIEIRLKGHYPVIPHLYDDFDQIAKTMGHNFDWQSYMDMDIELLNRCEAMYFIGPSPGANIEFRHAQSLDMPIYLSLDEVPELKKEEEKEEGLRISVGGRPPRKSKWHLLCRECLALIERIPGQINYCSVCGTAYDDRWAGPAGQEKIIQVKCPVCDKSIFIKEGRKPPICCEGQRMEVSE